MDWTLPFWMFPSLVVFVAQWQSTPRGKRLLEAMRLAIKRAGMSDKEAAITQGISPTQWARQCAMRDNAQPSLARAGELPDVVLAHFAQALCENLGLRVIKDEKMRELIAKLDKLQVEMLCMELELRRARSA